MASTLNGVVGWAIERPPYFCNFAVDPEASRRLDCRRWRTEIRGIRRHGHSTRRVGSPRRDACRLVSPHRSPSSSPGRSTSDRRSSEPSRRRSTRRRRVPPARHVADEFRVDEADDVRAVGVHHVKVGRARAVGDERDPFPIGRPARISVFRVWAALKVAGVARVGVDREDFRVAGPHCGDEEGLAGEAGTGQDDRQHNEAVDLKMMFPFGNR